MNPLSTVYATKRRRRNGKSLKPPPKDGVTKSNPSKRHRERLNAELDTLANLLPFEQNILSKLDRLSILRLSVSYLRTKSYFQVTMHNSNKEDTYRIRPDINMYEHAAVDGDMFLQALNGFLVILTCEGEVFYATHTIENYLGFHQSDIVHQSVYELVHSEDREELQRQLMWNSFLPAEQSSITLQEAIMSENSHLLERSFTVRFRCLLDNTSGFLRLDIRGRVRVLHGQNRKCDDSPLALFAICTPFGPPSLLEIPHKEVMFKSKHKLDLSLVSMDQRGKLLLGYTDPELANMGGYDLVHYDDLAYVASAHQELLKTGASGMIAYRYQTKDGQWQWLQTSSRLVYKNSKPDFVICTHRPLMEEEGRDLIGKRTMDFKVSYLDAGLTNSYFSDSEQIVGSSNTSQYSNTTNTNNAQQTSSSSSSSSTKPPTPQRVNRRYKTQLRDFLTTCRTKRKLSSNTASLPTSSTTPTLDYATTDTAAVVAYSNLNPMYPYNNTTAAPTDNNSLYMGHASNYQPLYDNRLPYDNLFHQYRPLTNYYTDYSSASYNGFIEVPARNSSSLPTYDNTVLSDNKLDCDKLYSYHQQIDQPYHHHHHQIDSNNTNLSNRCYNNTISSYIPASFDGRKTIAESSLKDVDNIIINGNSSKLIDIDNNIKIATDDYNDGTMRQTVVMWALNHANPTTGNATVAVRADDIDNETINSNYNHKKSYFTNDPLKSLAEMNSMNKWKNDPALISPKGSYYHHHHHHHHQYATTNTDSAITEVWPAHHHYHHRHHTVSRQCPRAYPQINRTEVLCCASRR